MDWVGSLDTWEYIGKVAGAVLAVAAVIKLVKLLIRRATRALARFDEVATAVLGDSTQETPSLRQQISDVSAKVDRLQLEVLPNHGGSINDQMSFLRGEFRAQLDADLSTAFFAADADGLVTWVSRQFLRWFGAKEAELRGLRWFSLLHPEDRESVAEEWLLAVKDQRGTRIRARFQNGEDGWKLVTGEMSPIFGATGTLIGYRGWLRSEVGP